MVNETSARQSRACWSGVLAMTLCAFTLVASEFMPVSLLTPVSRDLAVSEGLAGLGIAISGALAVLTSLFLSSLAGGINRKIAAAGPDGIDGRLRSDYRRG
jgi:predicted MFS family arabinose efflux permease